MSYELTTVVAATTKTGKPYLRFSARTGETVSVFSETPLWSMLHRVYPEFGSMLAEQRILWETHPICVEMYKDAKGYWQITRLSPRGENAMPDVPFEPDRAAYKQAAINWARGVIAKAYEIVVFDMETTTNDRMKAEPLSIGLYKPPGQFGSRIGVESVLLDTLVKPISMKAVTDNTEAAAVHKITPDMLANAPTFTDISATLFARFMNRPILGYNVGFDLTVLHFACARHQCTPIAPFAVIDAIEPVSWYMGDWNADRQSFTYKSLEDAAAHFGLAFGDAHNALADCRMTWRVIEAMAA